jgi:predicted chitinase
MANFKFEFDFTPSKLEKSLPRYQGDIAELFLIFQEVLPKYRITSEPRLAAFIDQFEFKSNGFVNLDILAPGPGVYLRQFSTYNKIEEDEAIKYSKTLKGAIDSAGWFWNINYLNLVSDNCDFKNLTKRINPTTDVPPRADNFKRILNILMEKEQ